MLFFPVPIGTTSIVLEYGKDLTLVNENEGDTVLTG